MDQYSTDQLSRASYKEIKPQECGDRFREHLLSSETCRSSLKALLMSSSTTTRDYSLEIDAFDLIQADPIVGHLVLRYPTTMLGTLEKAIVSAQEEIRQQIMQDANLEPSEDMNSMSVKGAQSSRVHARLIHLPPTCCKTSLASLQASDVGKIVQCSGTVVRTTPICMYESCREYRCVGKNGCKKDFCVYADLEQRHNALVAPDRCLAGSGQCKGRNFQVIGNGIHTDYQEVTIQEAASQLGAGSHVPRSLLIKLQHDLVDKCKPGDSVVIVGQMMPQWHQPALVDVDCPVGMALRAHSIRVVHDKGSSAWASSKPSSSDRQAIRGELDEDKFRSEFLKFWEEPRNLQAPIAARDYICKAVCPKLYGMSIIKLALLMTLIGGEASASLTMDGSTESHKNVEPEPFRMIQNKPTPVPSTFYGDDRFQPKQQQNHGQSVQTRRRGQSHLLLVGDPGTGKSQFLRFASALCPRSVLTTGVGTTSAGLTCAAVRENGKEFSLEAGALVLADQGVCCIDEFGCIRDEDRTTIHEAMEQQTVSVAKAGIVCKLNCRTTIIAVMNPKDCLYDNQASLSRNTGLGTPLLSRFDVIFKLVDSSDAERDSNVTTYLLNRAIQGAGLETSTVTDEDPLKTPWSMEKLRAYISFVREKFTPAISDDAAMLLERHYKKCRSSQSSTIPVTVRFLESLIRLSQAHARLMFRKDVTLEDAVAVIRVMECTAFTYGGFDGNANDGENILFCDPMTIDFSTQPDIEFAHFKVRVLNLYGMQDRLTVDEVRLVNDVFGCIDPEPRHCSGCNPTVPSYAHDWSGVEKDRDLGIQEGFDTFQDKKRRRQHHC